MKRVILSSYSAQIYTVLIGVVMMPIYLHYLGTESMGLVGFFTMLQTWLTLLDFGLTPTLSRQMATYKAGTLSKKSLGDLLLTLEWFFGSMGLLITLAGVLAAPHLAGQWLQLDHLESREVAHCIAMMAACAGLRWMATLYRSGLIGLEAQHLCNGLIAGFSTLKFVGVVPWMMLVSPTPTAFFAYLLVTFAVESVVCRYSLLGCLGKRPPGVRASWSVLKSVLPFAGGLALATAVWLVVMNLDKLLLSHFLPLKEYGYFSIAIAVAGGIVALVAPISQVVQPRLTILFSQGKREQEFDLFREASQFTNGLMGAVCLNVAVFAQPLLYAWTGNIELSTAENGILFWYALGNGLAGVTTIPYLIQYARGDLRLHVIGRVAFGAIQIPAIVYAAWACGALGTGMTWFAFNALALLTWTPIVFRRYLAGMYLDWVVNDVLLPWAAASVPVLLFRNFFTFPDSRMQTLGELLAVGAISLLMAWTAGAKMRPHLFGRFAGNRR